jgi:signal transduction histidine kinase
MYNSYRVIYISLIVSLVAAIGLQAYWIHSFYREKSEAFETQVHAALDQIRDKLYDRANLRKVKHSLIVVDGDTIVRTGSRSMSVGTGDETNVNDRGNRRVSVRSLKTSKGGDTIGSKGIRRNFDLVVEDALKSMDRNNPDVKRLVNKMLVEINDDMAPADDTSWLRPLVNSALHDKGIFTSFELQLARRGPHSTEILARTKGYRDEIPVFTSDLSAGRLVRNDKYLSLQFPDRNSAVFAQMKGSVGLSAIFSIILMGIFAWTVRIVRRQKRIGEIRDDFVNNMNHELKTPVATISLAVDALADPRIRLDEGRFSEYSRILKEENGRLNDHIDRVLQMSLVDGKSASYHSEPVELSKLARETVAAFRLRAQEKDAVITVNASHDTTVLCDRAHMKSVFSNLIDNALKYSGHGTKVSIDIARVNGHVTTCVRDNGIGIPDRERSKIFEKFYRVSQGNRHDIKGFGLGLSYVRSVVEAHGGTISVSGNEGTGASFTISLPAYAENPAG